MENENIQDWITKEPAKPALSASNGFAGLGIHEQLMKSLETLKFTTPTPIQHQAIPVAIEGKDVIGIAQTGTGKTLAFGIPMIQRLSAMNGKQGLIILPTRELALQVDETLHKLSRGFGLRTSVLIGGTPMFPQIKALRNNPHIIIATPGRLNDHLTRKTADLRNVAILVLDEADHMFDMGFAPQIAKIMAVCPREKQNMLFSATMPPAILKIATTHMTLPLRFEIAPQGTTAEKVEHELFFVQRDQRMPLLLKILAEKQGNVLLFLRTKHNAKKVCSNLQNAGITSAELHSNRSLSQRRAALDGFKLGRFRVLVATDIASRGIDVKGLTMVINYDLPESAPDYVHRIGRTGRAGMTGKAISFAMPDQRGKIKEIERLIRYTIPVSQMAGMAPVSAHYTEKKYVHNNYFQKRRSEGPFKSKNSFQKKFSKKY